MIHWHSLWLDGKVHFIICVHFAFRLKFFIHSIGSPTSNFSVNLELRVVDLYLR